MPRTPHARTNSADDHVCIAIYQVSNRVSRLYGRILTPHGLTFPQFQVLMALYEHGHCSVGTLCRMLDLDTSTITPVLKRLEAGGFIARFRDRIDERRVFVMLADRGTAFESEARRLHGAFVERLGLSTDEQSELRHVLGKMAASLTH